MTKIKWITDPHNNLKAPGAIPHFVIEWDKIAPNGYVFKKRRSFSKKRDAENFVLPEGSANPRYLKSAVFNLLGDVFSV